MPPPSILVLGAGELGTAVIHDFVSHASRGETEIAVLLRPSSINSSDEAKKRDIEALTSLGLRLVAGDVVNDATDDLTRIFNEFHTVISCTGMTFPPGTQTKVATAVLNSKAKRYFPWQFGVDYDAIGRNSSQDLFTEQLDVRALLRNQSRTDWVIVSTGMFLSFLFEPAFGIVNEGREIVTAIGSWSNAITVTSPADIGKLTAEIAMVHSDAHGVIYVTGDTVSMEQVADIVDAVADRKVVRRLKSVAQLLEELAADPDDGMKKYRVVFAEGIGISWDKASSFNEMNHIPTMTVKEWAAQNLKR